MSIGGKEIKNIMKSIFGSTSTTDDAYIANVFAQNNPVMQGHFTDAGTAGNAAGEWVIGRVPYACVVKDVYITTGVDVAADNTDYATITFAKRAAADYTTAVTIASSDTRAANLNGLTAFTPASIPLTAANVVLTAGDVLTIKATKAASGKALGAAVTAAGAYVGVSVRLERLFAAS